MAGPFVVTGPLRDVRDRLRRSLESIAERVGQLSALPLEERSPAMAKVAGDLDAVLRPHLEWEERTVHPVVDKFACEGPAAFSASMRYEHAIIHRSIGELRELSGAEDVVAFSRRADNLLGIVFAHFELEEQIVFPILDRALGATGRPIAPPSP